MQIINSLKVWRRCLFKVDFFFLIVLFRISERCLCTIYHIMMTYVYTSKAQINVIHSDFESRLCSPLAVAKIKINKYL